MINVLLQGHEYKHEVFELIRLFFRNDNIEFIDEEALGSDQNLLIENRLFQNSDVFRVETKIYKNGDCISSYSVNNIGEIGINDINKKIRIAIKQSIFKAISKFSSVDLPWGILTGVRPTKIVHDLIDKGYRENEISEILLNVYYLSSDKVGLLLEVATRQRRFITTLNDDKFSLYVSIPFCPTRCLYCSFPSNCLTNIDSLVDQYIERLLHEIRLVGALMLDKEIDTVYIGGGTPTSIPVHGLNKIIKEVYRVFGQKNIREFTVEAGRPDTIDIHMLSMLRENNIERISINPQTMDNNTLAVIGRNHTSEEIVESYYLAKKLGFSTINMDIIVGLPGEGPKEVEHTMNEIFKLNPNNLTVHTMAVKRSSRLKENIEDYHLSEKMKIEDMLAITKEYSHRMNMKPYYLYRQKQILGNFENVGYTTEGHECIYNILIMEEKQTIIAAGAGATSKIFYPREDKIERVPNVKSLSDYISRTEEMVNRKKKYLKPVDSI